MPNSVTQSDAKKQGFYIVKGSQSEEVVRVVFPNGIQVGMATQNFNKGITLPNLSDQPEDVTNVLYAIDGDIYFNGVLVAPADGGVNSENSILASQIFG